MEKNSLNGLQKMIIIGGSAGSLEVLLEVLPQIGPISNLSIIIVLHRRNSEDALLEELLRMKSGLKVEEIEDKTSIKPGFIYVAPADYHLLIENDFSFALDVSEKVHYSRPSIDVAFESTALVFTDKLVAILLSGANSDGTDGLRHVKANGGQIIVQSPQTAEFPFMPQYAKDHIEADHILSPEELIQFISRLDKSLSSLGG